MNTAIAILETVIVVAVFLLLIIVGIGTISVNPINDDLIRACSHYASTQPWRSIPIERQRWMDSIGEDYIHYNYYQDCINQKTTVVYEFNNNR